MVDKNSEGKLTAQAFCIACKIISMKVKDNNMIIPETVPPSILMSIFDVEKLLKDEWNANFPTCLISQ